MLSFLTAIARPLVTVGRGVGYEAVSVIEEAGASAAATEGGVLTRVGAPIAISGVEETARLSLAGLTSLNSTRGATMWNLEALPLFRALDGLNNRNLQQSLAFTFTNRVTQPHLAYVSRPLNISSVWQTVASRYVPLNAIEEITIEDVTDTVASVGTRASGVATATTTDTLEQITQTGTYAGASAASGATRTVETVVVQRDSLLGSALVGGGALLGGLLSGIGRLLGGLLKGAGSAVGGVANGIGAAIGGSSAGASVGAAVGGTAGAAGMSLGGQPNVNQVLQSLVNQSQGQLELNDNDRDALSDLLVSDYNYHAQMRAWAEVPMINDAYRYVHNYRNAYDVLRARGSPENDREAEALQAEAGRKLAQATQIALNTQSATPREGEMFSTIEQLMAADGFNLDIFNSDDLAQLQQTRAALQAYDLGHSETGLWHRAYNIVGQHDIGVSSVTWGAGFITRRETYLTDEEYGMLNRTMDGMITTYRNALDARIALVSKVYEIRARQPNLSDLAAGVQAAAEQETAQGFDGLPSSNVLHHFQHQGTFLDTFLLSSNETSSAGNGVDTGAAAASSTSAQTTTQGEQSTSPPTQQTPSGGVHPLFVPLVVGNLGNQPVSVGRPQTDDVSMHHDLVWKPSGGSNNSNYVPQQRDYVTPQTVDTSAVLLPLAALATFILVR